MKESRSLLHRFGPSLSALAVGVAAATQFATPAIAQIEEVVVYSQKKPVADSVQDVPSAITVVDEALIQKTFSVDLTDIGRLSPNVQLAPVSTFPNFANFTIRGIGVNNSVRTVDPAVNIYQDGMVYGFQVGTVLDVFDLESVEVLRAPRVFCSAVIPRVVRYRRVPPDLTERRSSRAGSLRVTLTGWILRAASRAPFQATYQPSWR